jgi:hypothetical protein
MFARGIAEGETAWLRMSPRGIPQSLRQRELEVVSGFSMNVSRVTNAAGAYCCDLVLAVHKKPHRAAEQ